ncbi:MAG: HD domain-containing protein [Desulfovibrio sp.]|jgi:tRNA nucleotidyltransferase (CCA-adding enzyme)|nr:HD domain-containing protein [Desulfovibrio sp.]
MHEDSHYLVGGAVRDLLLGDIPKERDYAFPGGADAFMATHEGARRVGRTIDVWLWRGCEFMPLRGGTITSDLLARDLTVNAMALDDAGKLHCHPLALEDLAKGCLRPASPTAMADEPARVFRLARFAARWPDWEVHEDAIRQLRRMSREDVAALPAERVCRELRKALECPRPGRFFEVLAAGDMLRPWFEELADAAAVPAGPKPYHDESLLEHTCQVMDAVAGDPMAAWMALCHDLGKGATDPALWPSHHGHEAAGVELVERLCRRLSMPTLHCKAGTLAAEAHMRGGRYLWCRAGTRRDLVWRMHRLGLSEPFWRMVDADAGAQVGIHAMRDLAVLQSVRLPEEWWDRGDASGERLRILQCQALAHHGTKRAGSADSQCVSLAIETRD